MAGKARGVSRLSLAEDGAEYVPGAAIDLLPKLAALFETCGDAAGTRLTSLGALTPELSGIGSIAKLVNGRMGVEPNLIAPGHKFAHCSFYGCEA